MNINRLFATYKVEADTQAELEVGVAKIKANYPEAHGYSILDSGAWPGSNARYFNVVKVWKVAQLNPSDLVNV